MLCHSRKYCCAISPVRNLFTFPKKKEKGAPEVIVSLRSPTITQIYGRQSTEPTRKKIESVE